VTRDEEKLSLQTINGWFTWCTDQASARLRFCLFPSRHGLIPIRQLESACFSPMSRRGTK